MKFCRIVTAVFAALISSPLAAQWWSGNEKISDEPWRRGKNDFGAMLLLTPAVERFYEEWSKPQAPNITTAESTQRNKPLNAVVLFTGCKVSGGNCNIRVDFIVLKPDGSNYGSLKDVAAWVNKPGAPKGMIRVSQGSLRIVIEPSDPGGKYVVKAIVRDLNAKIVLKLEQAFAVDESTL